MPPRKSRDRNSAKCLSCGTSFDPNRYKRGCPTCERQRMNETFATIRTLGKERR